MSTVKPNASVIHTGLDALYTLCDRADQALARHDVNDANHTYQLVIAQASQLIETAAQLPNAYHALTELHLLSALAYTEHAKWEQAEVRAGNISWAVYHCMLSLEALRASGDFTYRVVSAWHLTYAAILMSIREMVRADVEANACVEDMITIASTLLGESLVYEVTERMHGIEYLAQSRLVEGFSTAERTLTGQKQVLQQALVAARQAYWHFMETSDLQALLETQSQAINLARKIAQYV